MMLVVTERRGADHTNNFQIQLLRILLDLAMQFWLLARYGFKIICRIYNFNLEIACKTEGRIFFSPFYSKYTYLRSKYLI